MLSNIHSNPVGYYGTCHPIPAFFLFLHFDNPVNQRGPKLCLRDVSITNEDVQCLLSEGNHLECLRITYCKMLTSLRIPHCLNRLKVLLVLSCPLLQDMTLDCGVPALHYRGSLIPMEFAAPLELRKLSIELLPCHSALGFIFNELPATLPRLEMLSLSCTQLEVCISPAVLYFHWLCSYLFYVGFIFVVCRRLIQ